MRRKSIVGGGALICLAPDELGHLFSHLSSGDQRLLFLSRIYFCLRPSKGLHAHWFAAVVFRSNNGETRGVSSLILDPKHGEACRP